MKKIISILLAAVMVLAFAACGNNSGNNGGNDAAVTDPLEVLNKVWSALPEDYKFPAAGGDNNNAVEDKPASLISPMPTTWTICCPSRPIAPPSSTAPPPFPT